jgi:hypothetical protein
MAKAKRGRIGERTSSPGQHPLTTDKEACAPKSAASRILVLGNQTKKAMCFVSDSGCEINPATERKKIP